MDADNPDCETMRLRLEFQRVMGLRILDDLPIRTGERLRFTFVNDTMMAHPLHLHGMWMELENGNGHFIPRKHTVSVKPSERVSVAITADAPGKWAFHCHLLLHMEMGMFRVIEVSDKAIAEVKK